MNREESITEGVRDSYLRKLVDVNYNLTDFGKFESLKCDTFNDIKKFCDDFETAITLKKFSNSIQFSKSKYPDITIATDEGYEPIEVRLDSDVAAEIFKKQNEKSYYHILQTGEIKHQWEIELELESLDDIGNEIQDVLTDTRKVFHDLDYSPIHKPEFISDEVSEFNPESGFDSFIGKIQNGFYAPLIQNWYRMPGNGFAYQGCGTHTFFRGCVSEIHRENNSDQDYVKRIRYTCDRISCTNIDCIHKAISKKSKRAFDRIESAIILSKSQLYENPRKRIPLHIVWSPKKEDCESMKTDRGMKKIERKMRRELKKVGVVGGVSIYHPWRFDKKQDGQPYFSPHSHILGLGYVDFKKVKKNYNDNGSVIKVIRAVKGPSVVKFILSYLLSHAGVKEGHDVVKYFGSLSYNKFQTQTVFENSLEMSDDINKYLDQCDPTILKMGGYDRLKQDSDCKIIHEKEEYSLNKYDIKFKVSVAVVEYGETIEFAGQKESSLLNDYDIESNADFRRCKDIISEYVSNHKDYPALPPSTNLDEEAEKIPHKILVMRFDYLHSIKETRHTKYLVILLDSSIENICPICNQKLSIIVPKDRSKPDMITDLPIDIGVQVDQGLYEMVEGYDIAGKILWDKEGNESHATKIGIIPDNFNIYPGEYQRKVNYDIHYSVVAYTMLLELQKVPTKEDVLMRMDSLNNTKSVYGYKTTKNLVSMTEFFD